MRRNNILLLIVVCTCLVLSGLNSAKAQCALPYQLTNGQTADATQVMANLTALVNCLSANAPAGSTNALQFNAGSGTFGAVGPLTNGQLAIGSTGAAPQAATLTAGTGISITNSPGSVTIAATGGAGGNVPTAASVSTNGNPCTISDGTNALKIVTAAVGNDSSQGSIIYQSVSGVWSAKFKLSAHRSFAHPPSAMIRMAMHCRAPPSLRTLASQACFIMPTVGSI